MSPRLCAKTRQDIEHLKILIFCVRGFLREVLQEAERGNVPVRGWLGAINKLSELVKSAHGRKAAKQFQIQWPEILPASEIAEAKNEKIILFREKQLTRVFDLNAK